MITALAVRKSPYAGVDVAGIFDRLSFESFPAVFSCVMVAKIVPEPSDVTTDDLVLQIFRSDGGCVYEEILEGTRPTYKEWVEGAQPYVSVHFKAFSVYQPDTFSFQLGTKTHVLKDETISVELGGQGI